MNYQQQLANQVSVHQLIDLLHPFTDHTRDSPPHGETLARARCRDLLMDTSGHELSVWGRMANKYARAQGRPVVRGWNSVYVAISMGLTPTEYARAIELVVKDA